MNELVTREWDEEEEDDELIEYEQTYFAGGLQSYTKDIQLLSER